MGNALYNNDNPRAAVSTLGGELGDEQFSILQIMSIGLWVTILAPFGQLYGALVYLDNPGEPDSVQIYDF